MWKLAGGGGETRHCFEREGDVDVISRRSKALEKVWWADWVDTRNKLALSVSLIGAGFVLSAVQMYQEPVTNPDPCIQADPIEMDSLFAVSMELRKTGRRCVISAKPNPSGGLRAVKARM